MSNIISDSVSKLSAITDQTPIDWDAFDSVLKGLEDINAYDEHDEETILSEFIMDGEFYKRGFILADEASAGKFLVPGWRTRTMPGQIYLKPIML